MTHDPPPTPIEDLVASLYTLGLVHRELARHALAGLGSHGFPALAIVAREGPVRVSDVAERLNVDLSVASRQIAGLVAAGHVRREADPDDRRAQRISVTPAGKRVLRTAHRRLVEAVTRALDAWPEDDVAGLAAQLDRLRADFARAAGRELQEVAR